jgi:hypothetical protein
LAALSETVAVSVWPAFGSVMLTPVNGWMACSSVVATLLAASVALTGCAVLVSVMLVVVSTAGVPGNALLVSVRVNWVVTLVFGTASTGVNDRASSAVVMAAAVPVSV